MGITKIKKKGLSPSEEQILSILEYKKIDIIKKEELINLIKKHVSIKDVDYLIEKLLYKKRIKIIKKGMYLVIPISSIDQNRSMDELKIINYLLEKDYYIGLYNAFNYHGFTEQIPNKTFIFNTKYSSEKEFLNHKFKFFKIKKSKIFGILKNNYSDKERTIIDSLNYFEYFGNLSSVFEKIKLIKYNEKKLIDYSIKFNSIKVLKLIGYITNSEKIYNVLKKKNALSYYTTIKKTNMKLLHKKWKLRLI
ncbi:MAG: type IV toxin-antitoxin system AbiEi family antitoxin domain-containing protein [Candidatus Woesearchaeota archaeon]